MKRKWFLFTCLITALLFAGWLYYNYQKPRANIAKLEAAYSLRAENLYLDFALNEAAANQKYTGKIIEVKGAVSDVQQMGSSASILLAASNEMGGINCSIRNPAVDAPVKGQIITVKGRCTGFLMDVNLVDAVLVK